MRKKFPLFLATAASAVLLFTQAYGAAALSAATIPVSTAVHSSADRNLPAAKEELSAGKVMTAQNGIVGISTSKSSMLFRAVAGKQLAIVSYGPRYEAVGIENVLRSGATPLKYYPAYGMSADEVYLVAAVQSDGNMTLDPAIISVQKEQWENGEILTVTSKDKFYPVEIKNVFKSYSKEDIIETWTEIRNVGKQTVTLTRYMSGGLPIEKDNVWITTFYGTWADECRQCTEPLTRGIKTVKSTQGSSNTQSAHAETIISLDGRPEETHGRVIGAALCWGGNYELSFYTGNESHHRFYAGICSDNAAIPLAGGTSFKTPEIAFSYSGNGMGDISRNFHKWGRKYRLHNGFKERDIVLNSWEGIHLDLSEPVLCQMMADAAQMGVETFVLDDGWFGTKYSRTKPDSALGDWSVDHSKLPHGLTPLTAKADSLGIGFGLWIEPEMTNTKSELYEKHPDWVLKAANREPVYGRGGTQMVLDLCNPKVRDFVFNSIDRTLRDNPGISYIKWDCNTTFNTHGSQHLKNQNLLVTQWWKGFEEVCNRVREAWPDLTIQLCAAGGGRVNWGVLPWFDEFWTSDNTDALQRIYLQWGTSYFFPSIAAGAHISAVPNKATQRYTSLKYRIDVAMSGRLGLEFQPADMNQDEIEQCRRAIAEYKEIRPMVQFGDLYRIVSPYDDRGFASLMYRYEDRAVFFWWRMANFQGVQMPAVRMQGLEPEALYRINELDRYTAESPLGFEGKTFTGKFLMETGLKMPAKHNNVPADIRGEWSSRVLLLTKVQ